MREMVLSFRPDVYARIKSGSKVFEYRRTFPKEEILAYMYVSSPVKCITGIIRLGNRTALTEWYEKYKTSEVRDRISKYMKNSNYVMQIKSFQDTSKISLEELKSIEGFSAPQMYFYLDNYPKVKKYLDDNLIKNELQFDNSFEYISEEMVCQ
ncbi:MAG: hypothetical protein GXZ12_06310 [Clostridiaceae bacterium]|nr:hypothetical protein [Clostridiaceae bacterium]